MNRLAHTIRHELHTQYRNILIASGAIAGSMLVILMLGWLNGIAVPDLWEGYEPVMIILGLLITSGAFSELRSPGTRIAYLLRPAAVWEKVLAKLVVSTVFVWIIVTTAFVAGSIAGVLLYWIAGGPLPLGDALGRALADGRWLIIAGRTFVDYLPAHAIFFFGAVYFQKHNAGKTLLAIVGWFVSYGILAVISVRVVFHRYFVGDVGTSGPQRFGHFDGPIGQLNLDERMWREIAPFYLENPDILRVAMIVGVVVLFWGLTALRLRETEA